MMRVSGSDFVTRYGDVYERSAWVAERAAPRLDGCDEILIALGELVRSRQLFGLFQRRPGFP